jgi:hypothetical protein
MREVNGGAFGSWGLQLEGSVGSPAVVVTGVFAECSAPVSLVEDEHVVGDLGAAVRTNLSA